MKLVFLRRLTLMLALGAVATLTAAEGWADTIGVNFLRGAGQYSMLPGDMPGTPGGVHGNWNNALPAGNTGNVLGLVNDSNAATTAGVSWSSGTTWSTTGGATADERLMGGYLDANSTVNLTDIPYAFYDLYIYTGSDGAGRTGVVDIFSTPVAGNQRYFLTQNNITADGGYTEATATTAGTAASSNYVKYTSLTFSDLELSVLNVTSNVGAHGLQIVETDGTTPANWNAPPPPPADPFGPGAIGINFSGRLSSAPAPDNLLVESGASAGNAAGVPGTTTPWNDVLTNNDIAGSGITVLGVDGEQAANVEWSATGTWGQGGFSPEDPNSDMKAGHIEATNTGAATVTVSDLSNNYSSYDVYVYVGDDAGNRNGEISFNGGAIQNFTSKIYDGTWTEGTDYFKYTGVTGDSFTVSVEPQGDLGANRTGIHGIEIIGVPEPSSIILLSIAGLMGLVCGVRRRCKK